MMPHEKAAPSLPSISVLMPIRNEAAYVGRSIQAVLSQDYPSELIDILVADGMSTDGTTEIVRSIQSTHPNVRLLMNPGKTAPTALNLATRAASGDVLVRVDGHCEIERDYISNCVRHLSEDGVDGVGGSIETVGETDTAKAISLAMSSRFGVGNSAFRTIRGKTMLADTIPFPAYTRRIVERAGEYDESMVRNQDDEYNYRIRKMGGRLLLADDVRSRYYSRATVLSLSRQYFGYGFWKAQVFRKHPRQMSIRQFVPSLFVLCLATGLLLAPFSRMGRRLLSGTLIAYAAASGAASTTLAARTDWRNLRRLPVAFAAIHLSYGVGFLWGERHLLKRSTEEHNDMRMEPEN